MVKSVQYCLVNVCFVLCHIITGLEVMANYPTQSTEEKVCLALPVCFLFVYEISREPLNGYAPNSHGRRVWYLARTSLKVKGQGHHGQKTACSDLSVACVWFMFGKTSLASSFFIAFLPSCLTDDFKQVPKPTTASSS